MTSILIDIALTLLGVAMAYAAITTSRTPQGAVGWVVFLVSFPIIAIPAFSFFGRIGFRGYVKERRAAEKEIDHITGSDLRGDTQRLRIDDLAGITDAPVCEGNIPRLLIDAEQTFPAIFEAIDAAEHTVVVQSYIVHDDPLGRDLKSHLIAAARRGVKVRFLVDGLGSFSLPRSYTSQLSDAGIETHSMRGPRRPIGRFAVNFRNHRKIVVVDGRVGFTGGLNMGQEYVDGGSDFESWRDTHLRLEGPMVTQLLKQFERDWSWVKGEEYVPPDHDLAAPASNGIPGFVLSSGPTDDLERGSLFLCGMANLARKRLWLASPYFVPHTDFLTALQLAASRGVDVRLLIPRNPDQLLPWYAARATFEDLNDVGIRVWEYIPGFMHQKVILVDDDVASVGTQNLDIRSVMLNFETMAVLEGKNFAGEVEAMLEADFARSEEIDTLLTNAPWHVHAVAPIARLFAPIL